MAPTRFVEIRSYNLKPGTRPALHALMREQALPMLRRWKVDVVAYGPSPHDEDSYMLIRAYASLDDRQRSQDEFYGSAEWRQGPREPILALIANYTSVVLELDEATVNGLRRPL
jgi:NIPSNAP